MAEPTQPQLSLDPELPITSWADEIVDAIRRHQVVVVAGETGSGKTTQLPKLAMLAGREKIAHTQPRRIAARSVAERIAEEMGIELGDLVGYQVRFTRKTTKDTRLKLMTDGVLLNEISFDRDLRRYDTIIIDEAHERSLTIDFLLGYLKQLMPRRPDLKIIITSATIDTTRFSEHFDGAPIIEVSGRTYPVEIRYRPLYDDGASAEGEGSVVERDQLEGIADAVAELGREGDGDILVFLSGEREIRDTADHLASLDLRFTEIVPLYARLSAAEQHRVFSPHPGRRIVLATNVAETSLTVPGIRYVIDAGTARISRYSARTKVQRLPIEPISQASANQRSGRCGRVAPGIAIRLYSEEDFLSRPEFTEPEILRTNLASVILQMANARLGSIVDFPFVEAPDRNQINDGLRLLDELGAIASGRSPEPKLTAVGKQLARIPVDPRLGRMIVAGAELGCLRDVLVIVAGLSIQDPRERPSDKQEQADAMHRRFFSDAILTGGEAPQKADGGDFLALLRLWRYVRQQQRDLSGNAFRRMCRNEFLSYLRLREWADLHAQLRDVAIDLGLTHSGERRGHDQAARAAEKVAAARSEADAIHTALLAGLLSHVGLADVRKVDPNLPVRKRVRLGPQEYVGARGSRFAINRGSSLAKNPPPLVMAFELVETTRLWARTVAAIDPDQVERVGGHLLKRSYSEPYWSARLGAVMAYENVTLLGVPIVAQRPVHYAKIDPVESRALFIQKALVEGDWHTRHHFFARNQRTREQAEEIEERTRRRDILISDSELAAFYAARIPEHVVSQAHFDRWWREQRRRDEFVLDLTIDDLISDDAADAFDEDAFPDDWVVETPTGPLRLPITYTFDPGSGKDGVLVTVPLAVLNQLDPEGFTWQIPGHRLELATELIRSLPKQVRTSFVPAPNFAERALAWLAEHPERQSGRFTDALAEALRQLTGVVIAPEAWQPTALPSHLRLAFEVVENGIATDTGEDLADLQERLARRLSSRLTSIAADHARTGEKDWVFGTIPATTELTRKGTTIVGYPALVDEGSTVGLAVVDTPLRAATSHRAGLRRLVTLAIPDPTKWVVAHLGMTAKLALSTGPYASVPHLIADARLASVGELIEREGEAGQVRDEVGFRALCDRVRVDHADHLREVVDVAARTLQRQTELAPLLAALPDGDAKVDLTEQLKNLVFTGFIAATPEPHYHQLPRYLHAMVNRVARLRSAPTRDDQALDVVWELEDAYAELCAAQPAGPLRPDVAEIGWALEELRVSLFAQSLGTRIPISAKRVRTMIKNAS